MKYIAMYLTKQLWNAERKNERWDNVTLGWDNDTAGWDNGTGGITTL